MYLPIHPENPEPKKVEQVAQILHDGGIIIYPTGGVYGVGCDILNQKAVERVCRLRRLDPERAMLSFICKDISQIAGYAWQMDNEVFKLLKNNLPGPFTFILKSNNTVPRLFKNRKRTIGVRIPDSKIALAIVEQLGRPILSASLLKESEDEADDEYFTDASLIFEKYGNQVDLVIDGGPGGLVPTTLVDCSKTEFEVIREGAGVIVW
ncbi:MAG: threonylcarbamoyl-AMP synthase [Lewinellaceae bacterium]|nr:threonylcarbamoyl-AMP synthase [Lewinellaceae bacterium]